jgi:hypothetical protein
MEVISIVTSNKKIESLLLVFLLESDLISYSSRDNDICYFVNRKTKKYEIYFHFNNNIDEEFSYNFLPEYINYINNYFSIHKLTLIDISFKNHNLIKKIMDCFFNTIIEQGKIQESEIIIDDPFMGLMNFSNGKFKEVKFDPR